MNRKGINPLIVTSILVGLTIVISVTIFGFGTRIQQDAIDANTHNLQDLGLVKFSAHYQDAFCEPGPGNHCYRIFIKNNEDFLMNFVVVTNSPKGAHISGPGGISLGPYEQKVFNITYPNNLGNDSLYAEVDPVVR
jgi:hypothetical protein